MNPKSYLRWGLSSAAILLAASLGACDGITQAINPCSADGACEVDGVDLAISELKVDVPDIAEIGMPAVARGSTINVSYTVRNRGSETSTEETLEVCPFYSGGYGCRGGKKSVAIPALKPGERKSGTLALVLPESSYGKGSIDAAISGYDAQRDNDTKSINLLVEAPDLVSKIEPLATELKSGTALRTVLTIRNKAYVAGAGASRAEVCIENLISYSWRCQTGIQPVQIATPALAAGAVRTDTIDFMIPVITLEYPDVRGDRDIVVCADATDQVEEANDGTDDNCARTTVTVLPNLDQACTVKATSPGRTLSGTFSAGDCDLDAGNDAHVYSFQGSANATYSLTNNTTDGYVLVTVYDARGTRIAYRQALSGQGDSIQFNVATDARYYIVIAEYANSPSYALKFTQK